MRYELDFAMKRELDSAEPDDSLFFFVDFFTLSVKLRTDFLFHSGKELF